MTNIIQRQFKLFHLQSFVEGATSSPMCICVSDNSVQAVVHEHVVTSIPGPVCKVSSQETYLDVALAVVCVHLVTSILPTGFDSHMSFS